MFSVIIPAFNRKDMLQRAVRSVLGQSFRNFELIVVNDGSSEDLSGVRALVESNGHRFISLKTNSGVSAARNFGVRESSAPWLAFLDSDDLWLEDKLAGSAEFIQKNAEYRIFQSEERWFRKGRFVNQREIHKKPEGDVFARSLELCCISPSSVLMERSLFDEFSGFDERLRVCEDYELWLRISAKYQVGLDSAVLVEKYGGHQGQLSKSEVAIDRFRIFSLLKLFLEADLSPLQLELVLAELRKKTEILLIGARKNSNFCLIECSELILSFFEKGFKRETVQEEWSRFETLLLKNTLFSS